MMNFPCFNDDSLGQKATSMIIGVIVDSENNCMHFGASWNVIPFNKAYMKQEHGIRKRVVGEYYQYQDFFNTYLQIDLKENSDDLKSNRLEII